MSTIDDLMARVGLLTVRGAWADEQMAHIRAAIESALRAEYERGRRQGITDVHDKLHAEQAAEPVAYFCPVGCGCLWRDNKDGSMSLFSGKHRSCEVCENTPLDQLTPLYASPTKREPLTDEQILECIRGVHLPKPMGLTRDHGPYEVTSPSHYAVQLVRQIERAHGIGDE